MRMQYYIYATRLLSIYTRVHCQYILCRPQTIQEQACDHVHVRGVRVVAPLDRVNTDGELIAAVLAAVLAVVLAAVLGE